MSLNSFKESGHAGRGAASGDSGSVASESYRGDRLCVHGGSEVADENGDFSALRHCLSLGLNPSIHPHVHLRRLNDEEVECALYE